MANLSKLEVLEAFAELSFIDRAFVLSQITSGMGGASRANLHDDVAEKRFVQGRFCPLVRGDTSCASVIAAKALSAIAATTAARPSPRRPNPSLPTLRIRICCRSTWAA